MIWKRYSAVFLTCLFLAAASSLDAEESNKTSAPSSSFGQNDSSSTLFKVEKKGRASRLQLRGTATDRKYTGNETGSVGLEALFGHLFSPQKDQYSGYYFMTGKLESDNRQRFNATLGYFPPKIGGEAKLTYRLLHAEVHEYLPVTGEFEEVALEQGLGLYYKKRFSILLKELTFDYAYTRMGGESVLQGPYIFDTPTAWEQANIITGFGDIETHNALVEAAFGSDALDNPVVNGYRLDLGGGYQNVQYGEFLTIPEFTDEGFTGIAGMQVCTPFGVLKGGYRDSQSADTAYGGYQLGGLDLYYKNINYEYGDNEEIIGIAFTLDLSDPGSAFDRNCRPFFYSSNTGYTSVYQMDHIRGLASDEFTAKKVNEIKDGLYRVDKTRLPGNVRIHIDDSGRPRLIVTTGCSLVSIGSVAPPTATPAFGVYGNEIIIGLDGLPSGQQTIVARINDNCCGDTQVTLVTNVGSLVVDSVDVQEGVGCQPERVEIIEPGPVQSESQSQPQPQCLALGAICDNSNDTCCPGYTCELFAVFGNNSIYTCQ